MGDTQLDFSLLTTAIRDSALGWFAEYGETGEVAGLIATAFSIRAALLMSDLLDELNAGLDAKRAQYEAELRFSGLLKDGEVYTGVLAAAPSP